VKGSSPTSPEDILAGHLPHVQEIAEALRRLVAQTVPEAEERAYPGWHAVGYRHAEAGYFAGIFPREEHVDLLFEYGVGLPDPDGVLQGDGSQTRYIRIEDADEIPVAAAERLLRAALD
jgi:hypothetical protein